jgi:ubiquinone/menaquinone biosynthesis C-methylase UbiE
MSETTGAETTGVAAHYTSGSLLDKIRTGLEALGATAPVSLETLAMVDEFHTGGRAATVPFLARLGIGKGDRVVDLGCGIGGPARFAAQSLGVRVSGIDLTGEFIATGTALTDMAGLGDQVSLREGSILELPFADQSFDAAYMIHVGMNISDKAGIMAEAARVLKPGGAFGIYDIMRMRDADLTFPVPWAAEPAQSALDTPATYRAALRGAGFAVESETDQSGLAREFFARAGAAQARADGPPPLGLHLVLGPEGKTMMGNMVANIGSGRVAPVEIIARLPL